jgi:hypothetical protein
LDAVQRFGDETMAGVQTHDVIARRVEGAYEIRQRLDLGEITLEGGPYSYDEAVRRARALARNHRSIAWIEDFDGALTMLPG